MKGLGRKITATSIAVTIAYCLYKLMSHVADQICKEEPKEWGSFKIEETKKSTKSEKRKKK